MIVQDLMQKGYVYECIAPMGKDFSPEFKPEVTPKEMLELGVFEGHYLNDCQDEFPKEWFSNARISLTAPDIRQNCFGVKSYLEI